MKQYSNETYLNGNIDEWQGYKQIRGSPTFAPSIVWMGHLHFLGWSISQVNALHDQNHRESEMFCWNPPWLKNGFINLPLPIMIFCPPYGGGYIYYGELEIAANVCQSSLGTRVLVRLFRPFPLWASLELCSCSAQYPPGHLGAPEPIRPGKARPTALEVHGEVASIIVLGVIRDPRVDEFASDT